MINDDKFEFVASLDVKLMKSIDDIHDEYVKKVSYSWDDIALQWKKVTINYDNIIKITNVNDRSFFFFSSVSRQTTNIE